MKPINADTGLVIPPFNGPYRPNSFDWNTPHPAGGSSHEYAWRRMTGPEPPTLDQLCVEVGCSHANANAWWRKYRPRTPQGKPGRVVSGLKAGRMKYDPAAVWEALEADQMAWEREVCERAANAVAYPAGTGAAGIAVFSDLHIGGQCMYRELREDAEAVAAAGLDCVLCGDYLDNWIVGKLVGNQRSQVVRHGAALAAFRYWLELLGPRLVAVVGGNHDAWTKRLAGLDYVRDAVAGINPECLYDPEAILFRWSVGPASKRVLARHKWRRRSQYNVTHSIEATARFDPPPFDLGIAGHVHSATLCRPFTTTDPEAKLAVQVSTYKRCDPYAAAEGYPEPFGRGAAVVVLEEDGTMTGFHDVAKGIAHLQDCRRHWAA